MKLIRFGETGKEKPAILENDVRYDVSEYFQDYNEYFFDKDGLHELQKLVRSSLSSLGVVSEEVRLGPPVARPSKIICIGLNYADHAAESGMPAPAEPVVFFK